MELEAGVRLALDEVHALGQADGVEHAIVLRGGKEVGKVAGSANHVSFEGIDVRDGDIVVHNHPLSLNALSNVDVLQLFNGSKLGAMYAISRDGSVYKAQRAVDMNPGAFMYLTDGAIEIVHNEAQEHGEWRLNDERAMTREEGIFGVAHWINRMLHHAGIIRYSFELNPATAARIDEIDEAIAFPWRHVGN